MKPGGVLVASVWTSFEMLPLAGGVMAVVVGAPEQPPPFNQAGLLGLANTVLFDGYLRYAGFDLCSDHNTPAEVNFRF